MRTPIPLCEAQAELFRVLAHPVRVRVLQVLAEGGPWPVRGLAAAITVEPSCLSRQLTTLRHAGVVTAQREDGTVVYALTGAEVADLMRAARRLVGMTPAGPQSLGVQMPAGPAAGACVGAGDAPKPSGPGRGSTAEM